MKIKILITISILVLAVLFITVSCTITSRGYEEREGINQEAFFEATGIGDYAEVKRLIEAGAE